MAEASTQRILKAPKKEDTEAQDPEGIQYREARQKR
jgi:hypothetical protein